MFMKIMILGLKLLLVFLNLCLRMSQIFLDLYQEHRGQLLKLDDYVKLFQPISEFDVTTTLYRGLSGREATKSVILTDNATVAAIYVKNGMSVHSYKVTRFALFKLEQLGKLTHYT